MWILRVTADSCDMSHFSKNPKCKAGHTVACLPFFIDALLIWSNMIKQILGYGSRVSRWNESGGREEEISIKRIAASRK